MESSMPSEKICKLTKGRYERGGGQSECSYDPVELIELI